MRHYTRLVGSRPYKNYTEQDLADAVQAVRVGRMSQLRASERWKIPRGTLQNRLFERHEGRVGHPTVLSQQEETLIAETINQIANWGFPVTVSDTREIVQKYVTKQGRNVLGWPNNRPGPDFIEKFIARNNISIRLASNIKRARASVGRADIMEFFNNIKHVLESVSAKQVFNYDETNFTDDPGAKKC